MEEKVRKRRKDFLVENGREFQIIFKPKVHQSKVFRKVFRLHHERIIEKQYF